MENPQDSINLIYSFLSFVADFTHSMTSVLLTPAFIMPKSRPWTFSIHIPNHLLGITPRTVAVQTQLVHTCTFPVFPPPSSQLSRLEITALSSPSLPESKIFHLRKIPTIQPSLSLHLSCHCLSVVPHLSPWLLRVAWTISGGFQS